METYQSRAGRRTSKLEAQVCEWLRDITGCVVKRQQIIEGGMADAYVPALGLIVEVDGKSHSYRDFQLMDRLKERKWAAAGYTVVRVTNAQVEDGSAYQVLREHPSARLSPRHPPANG
jgi:very-short-patch-repair endonuclease